MFVAKIDWLTKVLIDELIIVELSLCSVLGFSSFDTLTKPG